MPLDALASLLTLLGLILTGVVLFIGFIGWWLRRELKGDL